MTMNRFWEHQIQMKENELWKHFQRNLSSNQFRCRYCRRGGKISEVTYENLQSHLLNNHQQILSRQITSREINRETLNEVENYQVNSISDEWLDRLALDGYPIGQILGSIFRRYQEDGAGFGKYMARRAASIKSSKFKVRNFLPKLPLSMEIKQIIPLLMDKYRISGDGAQVLLQDFHWVYQNQYEVISQLTKRGMTVLKHEQNRTNAVIIFCDEQMRNSFNKFGDVVCIDFKPITFKQGSRNKYNYYVGVFAGQDTNLHQTLFAVALINQDKYENYEIAIRFFFKAMKSNVFPESFVVGSCSTISKVINDLKQQNIKNGKSSFGCYLGWHYLIDNLAFLYRNNNGEEKNVILRKFNSVVTSLNKSQMQHQLHQLENMAPHDNLLHQFISDNYQFFSGQSSPSFVGFAIEKHCFAEFYKMMFNYLREVENFGSFFQKSLKMQQTLLSRIKKGYENMPEKQLNKMNFKVSDELRFLSRRLERDLFQKFLWQYHEAVKYIKIIAKSNDNIYYQLVNYHHQNESTKTMIYCVKFCLEDYCWKCNCGFLYATGIPCSHLIKMIRKFRGSLTYYINKRWMIQNSKFNPDMLIYPYELVMQPEQEDQDEQNQECQVKEAQHVQTIENYPQTHEKEKQQINNNWQTIFQDKKPEEKQNIINYEHLSKQSLQSLSQNDQQQNERSMLQHKIGNQQENLQENIYEQQIQEQIHSDAIEMQEIINDHQQQQQNNQSERPLQSVPIKIKQQQREYSDESDISMVKGLFLNQPIHQEQYHNQQQQLLQTHAKLQKQNIIMQKQEQQKRNEKNVSEKYYQYHNLQQINQQWKNDIKSYQQQSLGKSKTVHKPMEVQQNILTEIALKKSTMNQQNMKQENIQLKQFDQKNNMDKQMIDALQEDRQREKNKFKMTKVRAHSFQFNRVKLNNLQFSFNQNCSKNDHNLSESGQHSRSQGDE